MTRLPAALLAALLSASAPAQRPAVGAPPHQWATDPFYQRHVDAGGIPILASARTPDRALLLAREIVLSMLAARPDLAAELVRQRQRVAVMAADETTLDLPEQRGWTRPAADDARLTPCERKHYATRIGALTDRQYWDARARGMGGLLTSVGAENLLAAPGDRYRGSSVLVHEFAHAILRAAAVADPALHAGVKEAYAAAMARGLWSGEYASTTFEEYWAVGTQYWFNTARIAAFGDTRVLSDADLRAYDPGLYAVLARVYRGHQAAGDLYWMHPARVPPGPLPKFTAEVC